MDLWDLFLIVNLDVIVIQLLITYTSIRKATMISVPLPTNVHLFVLLLFAIIIEITSAWTAKWINLDLSSKISPPRSGHVAFGLNEKIYVFGGYAEDETTEERYPTNDLWVFNPAAAAGVESSWKNVEPPSSTQPQSRLVAASVTCKLDKDTSVGVVIGGWDSQKAGTGGVILKDVQVYSEDDTDSAGSSDSSNNNGTWKELSTDALQQSTSRLCAVTLAGEDETSSSTKVLIHNHRCTDHVILLDVQTSEMCQQPVTGSIPSARGLHSCVRLPGTNKIVLFGGAAQDGNMSNEVFMLDTESWAWEEIESIDDGPSPSPRASPCLIALDSDSCIVFGGATNTDAGLHGCSDTWLLDLVESKNNNDDSSITKAKWTQLYQDESTEAPPGRNAATLTPLPSKPSGLCEDENDNDNSQFFLLSGGWYPFRTTYGDNFVLKVSRE